MRGYTMSEAAVKQDGTAECSIRGTAEVCATGGKPDRQHHV